MGKYILSLSLLMVLAACSHIGIGEINTEKAMDNTMMKEGDKMMDAMKDMPCHTMANGQKMGDCDK